VVVSDYLIDNADLLAWIPDYHPMAGLTADTIVWQLIGKYLVPNCRIRDQVAGHMSRLKGCKSITVHIQGSDKIDTLRKLEAIKRHHPPVIEQAMAKDYAVWLMTDYKPFADEYRARLGDAISCQD